MNQAFRLLTLAILLISMLVGSVSAIVCPPIPDPPYIPEFPEEDIVEVEVYIDPVTTTTTTATTTVAQSLRSVINGPYIHVTVTFAAPTPPADKGILIFVTILQGNPPTEEVLGCKAIADPSLLTYTVDLPITVNGEVPSIAVYTSLVEFGTDRAPNEGFYQITSRSVSEPNVFQDHEPATVGGISTPISKLKMLTPYLAIAGLIVAVSTVFVIKKRKE